MTGEKMKSNEECVKLCAEAFKKGWKAKEEDLREWLEGASPFLNPTKKPRSYDWLKGYHTGQEAVKKMLLAELKEEEAGK